MRETLERLREIEIELAARARRSRLSRYNTGEVVHEKQLAFHRSPRRNRWVFGGNRSGKTECGAVEAVWQLRGCHPFRPNRAASEGWVVSLSAQMQRDVAQSKVLSYLDPSWVKNVVMVSGSKTNPGGGVIDYIEIESVSGGTSRLGFRNCEQGRDKFQGASLDFVWFDEEPPQDVYEECRMRILDRRGDIWGTMTPLKGLTWVYDKIYCSTDCNTESFTMEWADNPFLSREEIDQMSASMSEQALSSRRYGRFSAASGLVYPEFDPVLHVIDPFPVPAEWQDNISIDPGLRNPLSAHWYCTDYDGNVFVVAEHYEAGLPVEEHAAHIRRISAGLHWKTDSRGRLSALIDPAAGQRTLAAQKSVSELFYDYGILTATRINKDVFTGINRVKSYLRPASGPPRLYVFRCCVNLVREFKSYYWGSGDAPRKRDDHALDELRYYIMSRPEPAERKSPAKSPLLAEKERLIRRARRGGTA